MIGILFLGSCDACTSGLLSLEEELYKNIKKLDSKLLEGKCTKGPLLPMNYYHLYSCMCLNWNAFKDFT